MAYNNKWLFLIHRSAGLLWLSPAWVPICSMYLQFLQFLERDLLMAHVESIQGGTEIAVHLKFSAQYGHTVSSTQLPLVKASHTAKAKAMGLGCVFCPQSVESKYLLSTNAVYHNDLSDDLLHTNEIDMRFFGSLQECMVMSKHMANPQRQSVSLLPPAFLLV